MALAEAGEVGLDDRVRGYVPELRLKDEAAARAVTVVQLLNHSAGWNGDYFEDTGDGADAIATYVQKMIQLEQVSPPGAVASYNNAAYVLAGRLIEKVTGQPYEAATKRLILHPLGCAESFFSAGEVMTRRFAVGHACKQQQAAVTVARPLLLPRSSAPAGGLFSTARDQIRHARFHLGQAPADMCSAGHRGPGCQQHLRLRVPEATSVPEWRFTATVSPAARRGTSEPLRW